MFWILKTSLSTSNGLASLLAMLVLLVVMGSAFAETYSYDAAGRSISRIKALFQMMTKKCHY